MSEVPVYPGIPVWGAGSREQDSGCSVKVLWLKIESWSNIEHETARGSDLRGIRGHDADALGREAPLHQRRCHLHHLRPI